MLHCHEWPLAVVHIKPYSPPPRNIVQFYNRLDCRVCITRSFICIGESYLLCVSIIALFRVRGNTMSTMSTLSCNVKQSSLAKQGNITHTDSTTTDKKLHSFSLSLSLIWWQLLSHAAVSKYLWYNVFMYTRNQWQCDSSVKLHKRAPSNLMILYSFTHSFIHCPLSPNFCCWPLFRSVHNWDFHTTNEWSPE